MDVDVDQVHAPHHDPAQVDGAELGIAQVDGAEQRTAEVDTFELGSPEIGVNEVSHATTLMSPSPVRAVEMAPWRSGREHENRADLPPSPAVTE